MTNNKENAQDSAKDKAQELKDKTQETAQTAKEGAQATGDKSQETAKAASGPDESDLESTKEKAREVAGTASDKAKDVGDKAKETAGAASGKAKDAGDKVQETAKTAGDKVETDLEVTQEKVSGAGPSPTPQVLKAESSAQDLKTRLDWGEPGLTIVDVRSREAHNESHIRGAVPMPLNELVERAQSSLDLKRDVYVYGGSDKETSQAAKSLRDAGFISVSELKGGLDAWKGINGGTDGIEESFEPEWSQATNVVDRVKDAIDKTTDRPEK